MPSNLILNRLFIMILVPKIVYRRSWLIFTVKYSNITAVITKVATAGGILTCFSIYREREGETSYLLSYRRVWFFSLWGLFHSECNNPTSTQTCMGGQCH